MKKIIVAFTLIILVSCGVTKMPSVPKYKLNLLDEFCIPAKTFFDGEEIGGLSGMDFKNDTLFIIDDRSSKPILYTTRLKTSNRKIDTIVFLSSINLKKTYSSFKNKALDLESLRITGNDSFILSSEGNINREENPSVFIINSAGNLLTEFHLPDYFLAKNKNKPMHNGVFEAMTWDTKNEYIWVSTELPLQLDGKQPQPWKTYSPIRFTQFNPQTLEAEKQFIYQLDRIVRLPLLPFYINGVTETISINASEFFVVERAYSAGRGKRANSVKLFSANFENASNTLNKEQIKKDNNLIPAEKQLVLNFKKIRKQLPSKRIDNIEGLCFGPQLSNGNSTLLFVSDNNFNSFGEQITQFIWMELVILQPNRN